MREWKISADTGGTFTDCLLERPDGSWKRTKVLSSGCLRTEVAGVEKAGRIRVEGTGFGQTGFLAGRTIRRGGEAIGRVREWSGGKLTFEEGHEPVATGDILEIETGLEAPVLGMKLLLEEADVDAEAIDLSFRLGTTKGTNALLEGKGAPTALFLTQGFEDLLLIRDQKRPDIFARKIERPVPMYSAVFGVSGRIDRNGTVTGELDPGQVRRCAREALQAGCTAAAVCLLNSWKNPEHERQVVSLLESCGFRTIRSSAWIRPLIKYLDRTETTLVDATLSPVMDTYLDRVEAALGNNPLWIMSSAGGLLSRSRFHAVDSLVSGPAGGVLGAVGAARQAGMEAVIALDMGGTSTDVTRWNQGLELRQEIRVGSARILTPAMPIETVAAGGGSICGFDGERLYVGPQSAGADPGPAAYGAGGPLTLTDIHLLLGRMDPSGFSIPIRMEEAQKALEAVARKAGERDWEDLAEGFLAIATERMSQAIRHVSLREGVDPADYGLVAFGGAGGLHACRLATELGMKEVLIPSDAGILSARGIHAAPREAVLEEQFLLPLEASPGRQARRFRALHEAARKQLLDDGVSPESLAEPHCTAFVRIAGQETSLPVAVEADGDPGPGFRRQFVAIFGYYPEGARLERVKLRLRLVESLPEPPVESFGEGGPGRKALERGTVPGCCAGRGGRIPVFDREDLEAGDYLTGPAILRDRFGTAFVEPGWTARAGDAGSVRLEQYKEASMEREGGREARKVEKTLVLNRLEGLVEEMGDQLQRTALSANIRERLDFSCALLDREGRLLVNAPHIPVHLGALGLCVREILKTHKPGPGDVLITNHPGFGGSHLPDVTLVSSLFDGEGRLMGYLANRAHHAEWGGKTPGSMPADATTLQEEGVILSPQWLIRNGRDRFAEIEAQLREGPFPSRAVRENRIDLEAQLASLRRGGDLFAGLLRDYPPGVVSAYFGDLHQSASAALEEAFVETGFRSGKASVRLDDGHGIHLSLTKREGRTEVDFTGTDATHPGNLNATPAIVRSAVLYALRLFVDRPMPLNEGLLENVDLILPRCFLNPCFPPDPERCPAVVGGNVETSQALVEALIKALGFLAASQGTMNNLLFGNARFGYYETIGGGAGAGSSGPSANGETGFAGASGVHVHMTNTAITDPEILEERFPVECRAFSLRRGSGGKGAFPGGDGLCRELRFREPVTLSFLGQHRQSGPPGARGGGAGEPGCQWIVRADGRRDALGGQVRLDLEAGEGIRIETPGGGAWGQKVNS